VTHRRITRADASALLEVAQRTRHPRRDSALIALLLDSGARRGELAALNEGDLDVDRGAVRLGSGTSERWLRLGGSTLDLLRGPGRSLFGSDGRAPTARTAHELLRRLAGSIGLVGGLTCRDTRRTWLAEAAASHSLPVVLRLADHRSARVRRASAEDAWAAQCEPGWMSPVDRLLSL
jgi:integrase